VVIAQTVATGPSAAIARALTTIKLKDRGS
jgi:hypothetical protein